MVRTAPVSQSQEWVVKNDLLLVSRGIKNTAYFINEQPPVPTLAAQYFFHISISPHFSHQVMPEFIAWQINQKRIQDYFRKNSEGSTTKSIRREVVENIEVITPSISEQFSLIALQNNISLQQEKCLQLIENSKALMNKIAADLLK
ncbi:MAG: hypothetical protein KAG53_04335 [Endozoicomonadaceae bacterium]|nr:hypothetical protein [Endozoicomonadaceae bacterium]